MPAPRRLLALVVLAACGENPAFDGPTASASASATSSTATGEPPAAPTSGPSAGITSEIEVASSDPGSSTGCPEGQELTDWWPDGDGDGFGAGAPVSACAAPAGHAAQAGDCDDADLAVHPGAAEVCNGKRDDDCDGLRDEWSPELELCDGCALFVEGGRTYWLCPADAPTWPEAEAQCAGYGSDAAPVHLASVPDAETSVAIHARVVAHIPVSPQQERHIWIGLRRRARVEADCPTGPDGQFWEWVDGTPATYFDWNSGEPNNLPGWCTCAEATCPRENCAEIKHDGVEVGWNDDPCEDLGPDVIQGYICSSGPT